MVPDEAEDVLFTDAMDKYLDFEAFVYWLRPLFQTPKVRLPAHISMELGQECPGLLEFASREILAAYEDKSRSWQRLFNWAKIIYCRMRKGTAGLTAFFAKYVFILFIYAWLITLHSAANLG